MLFECSYAYCFQKRFPYQMMFMSLNSNMTEATSRVRTTYPTGVNPQFLVGSYISIFSFLCIVLSTIQFLMLFILAIALSVL
jgi:hypothetical protein